LSVAGAVRAAPGLFLLTPPIEAGWTVFVNSVQEIPCLRLKHTVSSLVSLREMGIASRSLWSLAMQCEARIHTRIEPAGVGRRGRRCRRPAESCVCGIGVCDQHRRVVTEWVNGKEQLNWLALREFDACGVEPRGPFISEDEQEPLEQTPFIPVE
jgi:hypothetical protein